MTSLTLSTLFCVSILGVGTDSYTQAHRTAVETGKPMIVMVSTDWCMPCQQMKKTVMPQVRKQGLLSEVAFAVVNPDHNQELAHQLTGGGPVPQLVMFRKTTTGWKRRKLIGSQTVAAVKRFILDGLHLDRTAKRIRANRNPVQAASVSTTR